MQATATRTLMQVSRRWWRPILLVMTLLMSFAVILRLLAPLIVSTNLVRDAMERSLTEWTGHDVTIDGTPIIAFWPDPRIEVSRVSIIKSTTAGVQVLARASKISAEFELLGALRGRPGFQDLRLSGAEVYLTRDHEGALNWTNEDTSRATESEAPAESSRDLAVGDVLIENGRLEVIDSVTGLQWSALDINGELRWPRFSDSADLEATTLVNGRNLQVDMVLGEPLLFLSGRKVAVEFEATSEALTVQFKGQAGFGPESATTGLLSLATTDAGATASWIGAPISPAWKGQAFTLEADVLKTAEALRFDNLRMALNDMKSTGVADLLLPPEGRPRLTGTLAFGRADLGALKPLMTPSKPEGQLPGKLEWDLRLSGQDVTAGPLLLTQAAFSLVNERGQSRLDIVDGSLEGGSITGRIVTMSEPDGLKTDLHLQVRNADLGALFQKLDVPGPLPIAVGSLEFSATLPQSDWNRLEEASGSFRVTTDAGILPDLDPETLLQRVGSRTYLPLMNPEGQDFQYRRLDLQARFERGLAEIQSGIIEGDTINATLTGLLPLHDRGLAISATLTSEENPVQTSALFIGGSLSRPVVIAVVPPGSAAMP